MNRSKSVRKLLFSAITGLCMSLLMTPAYADLTSMFEDLGSYGNVNGPQAFQGQTRNYYTGGSIFLRTPNKNYNLVLVQPPGLRAGCNGIDLWAGSFSWINSDQLTAMLRNIGASALGYAFELAIKSLSPLVADVMETMQTWAQKINAMNINSCQAGRAVVNGFMKTWNDSKSETATEGGRGGMAEDENDSRARSTDSGFFTNVLSAYRANPSLKDQISDGNITWRALKKLEGITDEEREVLMNIVGTIILDAETNQVQAIEPAGISLKTFVGIGGDQNITFPKFYTCGASNWGEFSCRTPTLVPAPGRQIPWSFTFRVRQKLERLRNAIASRTPPDPDDQAFVGQTPYPVYKMLAVSAATPGLSDLIIRSYEQIVAIEYASEYVFYLTSQLKDALDLHEKSGDKTQSTAVAKLQANIKVLRDEITQERMAAYKLAQNTHLTAEQFTILEKKVFSMTPSILANSKGGFGY